MQNAECRFGIAVIPAQAGIQDKCRIQNLSRARSRDGIRKLDLFLRGPLPKGGFGSRLRGDDARLRGDDARLRGDDARLRGDDARLRGDDARLRGDDARLRGDDARLRGDDARPGSALLCRVFDLHQHDAPQNNRRTSDLGPRTDSGPRTPDPGL